MEWLNNAANYFRGLWTEAIGIWSDGGWAMMAIAVIAMVMFAMGVHIHFRLRSKGFRSVPEKVWRKWINHPEQRSGKIGRLLDFAIGGHTLKQTRTFFSQLQATETLPFVRDLKVMKICVSAAPLVGLLGTVTGMLATFDALSSGPGGDQTMGMIASGISEALITTETGLVIALPGLFFQHQLHRHFEQYKAFLAHLETVCAQKQQKRLRSERYIKLAALDQIATRLRARLQAEPALVGPVRERVDAASKGQQGELYDETVQVLQAALNSDELPAAKSPKTGEPSHPGSSNPTPSLGAKAPGRPEA